MPKKKSYIFTNKKHTEKGIMAFILSVISGVSLAAVIILTYRSGGEARTGYGVTGLLVTVFSLIGLVLGLNGLRDRDAYKLFPALGTILNLLVLGIMGFLLYIGTYL